MPRWIRLACLISKLMLKSKIQLLEQIQAKPSFGWCNAHSVQASAPWRKSFKFQMKNTPQNQYFPANAERMDVHCLESGCIGKYIPLGPRDFPRAGILYPSALEIALGLRPRAISRASGCKIPALGKSLGPRGMYFPIHPPSRQCTDTFTKLKKENIMWYYS